MGASGKYSWGGDRRSEAFHAERQARKSETVRLTRLPVEDNRNRRADDTEYHQFPDKHKDGWTYYGDGREALDFFKNNSNYDDLIRSMSKDERYQFMRMWAPGRFMRGQQYEGFENMSASEQLATRTFDKFLDQSEITKPFTVYRESGFNLLNNGSSGRMTMNEIKALIGTDIYSAGSMSCGAAQEGLTIGTPKPVSYKINFPAGKGMGMWIGDSRVNDWGAQQREFMTNRDAIYTVKGVTKSGNKYIVELDYRGRIPHQYGGKVTTATLLGEGGRNIPR